MKREEQNALKERFSGDSTVEGLIKRLWKAENLLERSLFEFGSEMRTEVESFLEKYR